MNINENPSQEDARRKKQRKLPKKKLTNKNYVVKLKIVCQKFVFLLILGGIKMIDYLRNLFISWFNKILNWFSERQKKEMNTKKEIPFDKNKHADDDRAKRISEGFQALDEGCKSIANLRAEIEMSQTESKTFKDNEPKVNNDLDAPVPANNNIKNNLEENNMGLLQSKPKQPKTKEDFDHAIQKKKDAIQKEKDELRDLEKGRDEFIEKNGIKPIQGEKIFNTSISSIKSMNEDNKLDSNEYKPFLGTPANSNNAKFNEIDKQFQQNGQEIDQLKQEHQEMKKDIADNKRRLNKQEEDMKEVKKDIKDMKEEQINIKAMLAEMKEERKDTKRMLAKMEEERKEDKKKYEEDKKKSEENQKAHDEIMAMLWNKLDEWNGIKEPTREGNDNRESTNTSFSSFKYKNPFRNNKRQPKMERADMAQEYDNEN